MIIPRYRQRGALTIFTAVFVLILMTLMLMYASRVGLLEQRTSANEMRQKLAFHAAETALEQATEYMQANIALANSSDLEAGPDGLNTDPPGYRTGWFAQEAGTQRWWPCPAADSIPDGHPCGGSVSAAAASFFYDNDGASPWGTIPVNTVALAADTTARATATMCILDVAEDGTITCDTNLPDDEGNGGVVMMTLIGYGYSDCTDTTDPATCTGQASVSIPLTSLSNVAGSAGVPLVTKNTLPTTGTAEIVVNPNGGGLGVPLSVWANGNETAGCKAKDEDGAEVGALGHKATSWATCQYHEWFGIDAWPDPLECPGTTCKCDTSELISGAIGGGDMVVSSDIQVDAAFPCDLFEFYFGVKRQFYNVVKDNAEVLADCSSLNQGSTGFIWISGPVCSINSNTIIGSEKHPVTLVIASKSVTINGGAVVYGTLFVTDVEDPAATFEAIGGMTVFGQVVVDSSFNKLQGTFQVVYDDAIVARAAGSSGLGILNHGWRDWGHPDITW